jgi:hypothetical protein
MWFVPVLIFGSTLFGVIIYIARKISSNIDNRKYYIKNLIIILLTLIVGILGLYLNHYNINLMLHIQTVLLVIPIFTAGYYVKNSIKDLNKYLKLYIFIPVFIVLCYLAFYRGYFIELTNNNIRNVYAFYIISFIGIYFCLYLAKVINKISPLKKYFDMIGTYSFEIMATHFMILI